MLNTILLFDYLNLKELDIELNPSYEPGKDDITFLIQEAGQIASYCLAAFQRSGELHSKATLWLGYKKIELDAKYGSLIAESELPVTIKKEVSKSDAGYQKIAKEHEKAKAYVEFYNGLMSSFEKGHYWAKSKEQANANENKMSGYDVHEIINKKGGNEEEQTRNFGSKSVPSNLSNNAVKNSGPVEDVMF